MSYQLASPGDHRLLPAERAIQTFKNHLVAILHGANPNFPANQWGRLLPHAVATLNMLRQSRLNPRLSAYMQLLGAFDFNKTPLTPLGCKPVVHKRPHERGTWSDYGVLGYFIGPATEHYHNYTCYISSTSK